MKLFIVLAIFMGLVLPARSQALVDKELALLFEYKDTVKQDFKKPLREADKEINIVLSTGFLFYKSFISSQDKPSCNFTPSCSEYAIEAFHKKGVFIGWLSSFDRLTRCHGLIKPTDYHFDTAKMHFYDPVD
jgi:putative component of membrane protein insertase Oxa1/YidC/SpoIIIJ protein YidD